jgi:GT2 family glycosyltransferase
MSRVRDGLVSIIVPTYNRAAECLNAVCSALEQSYADVEVIVIDDGSRDETRELVASVDPRVRYVWQENAGVSVARNRGLAEAGGAFIAFLDSDDRFRPWKIEAQLSVLRAFPDAGMVWTDMTAVDPGGRPLHDAYLSRMYSAYRYFDRSAMLARGRPLRSVWRACPAALADRRCAQVDVGAQMFMGNLVHTSTVLVRRQRQLAAGVFASGMRTGEDYDFHYRVCRGGPVAYLDVSSILYQVGDADQLTAQDHDVAIARNTLTTISTVLHDRDGQVGLSRAMVRARLATVHLWVGRGALFEDRKQARRHALQSLRWRPLSARATLLLIASLVPPRLLTRLLRVKRALV